MFNYVTRQLTTASIFQETVHQDFKGLSDFSPKFESKRKLTETAKSRPHVSRVFLSVVNVGAAKPGLPSACSSLLLSFSLHLAETYLGTCLSSEEL